MIDWLTKHLSRKGIHPQSLCPADPRAELIRAVHFLTSGPNGRHEFSKLKSAWRRYNSDKKWGNHVIQVRLPPRTRQQLFTLSKGTSVSETVERLIKEESRFQKNKRQEIKDAIEGEIRRHEQSALSQLDKTQKESSFLKSQNKKLEAELCAAQSEIGNILLIVSELEIAIGAQAGDDLGLSSSDKQEALHRQAKLLDYYTARIKATASLPPHQE